MKILGAQGLTIGDKALKKIDGNFLSDGDACCSLDDGKFYWHEFETGNSAPDDSPRVIAPELNGTNKRWVLRGIYMSILELETLLVSTITQATSAGIDFNGIATLSGNTFTFNNIVDPPFVVNSAVLVENLNAEYLGGKHWTEFSPENILWSGDQWIPNDVDEISVSFPETRYNTSYSLFTELFNIVSASPSIIQHIVTTKTTTGFKIKLSSKTDDSFYRLQWAVLGDNSPIETYNLQTASGNNITDYLGNQIVVS